VQTISFSVRGTSPKAWGNNEWDWRKALAEQARKISSSSIPIPESARISVDIVFFLRADRADLDNLAKPVLDTLFRINRPQVRDLTLTAALFQVDDSRIYLLKLEKRPVTAPSDEGALVVITWE